MRRLDLNLLAGISLIPIEMPSAASPVNAYLVRDRPLTLVDTGPNLVPALEQLEQGLASHGYQIEDLERVVLTHPHIDHVGLAAIIRDRSGAEVCAAAGSERWLEHYRESELWTKGWREQLMLRHGVPAGVVSANAHGSVYRQSWDPSVAVDRSLADGELLEFEHRSWRIAARPGHSPFDLLLHDESGGHMLVGDHLIEHISSNPLITPIPGSDGASRPQALLQYRRSLAQTAEMAARVLLSGHGSRIVEHRKLIERRLASMDRRSERVHRLVATGARTAHQVARQIWGERAESEAWLTISEVLGHVDLLIQGGVLREVSAASGPSQLLAV
jgi:glyoxylase-like metal-dependent hydrolase (beta-lactamase superfamily II)